jgi:hypothetical protein
VSWVERPGGFIAVLPSRVSPAQYYYLEHIGEDKLRHGSGGGTWIGREDDPGRRFEDASSARPGERGKGGAEPANGSLSPVLEVLESPALLGRAPFVKHAALAARQHAPFGRLSGFWVPMARFPGTLMVMDWGGVRADA